MFRRKTSWSSREEHEADRWKFYRVNDALRGRCVGAGLAGLCLSVVLLGYGVASAPKHPEYVQATQSLERLGNQKRRLLSEERPYAGQSQELTKLVEMYDLERAQAVRTVDAMIAETLEERNRISKTPSFIENEQERDKHYLKYTFRGIGMIILSALGSLVGFRIAREYIRAKYGSRVRIPAESYD